MDQLLDTIVPAAKYQYLTCNFARLDGTAIAGVKPLCHRDLRQQEGRRHRHQHPGELREVHADLLPGQGRQLHLRAFAEGNNGQDLYDSCRRPLTPRRRTAPTTSWPSHTSVSTSPPEPWRSTDVIANTTGLDAVLDGHSHSTIPQEIVKSKDGKDVILSSTGTKLNNLGKLTISADGKLHSELISDLEIEKDAKTKEVVDKIVAEFQAPAEQGRRPHGR